MLNENYEHQVKFIFFLIGHWYSFHLQIWGKWLNLKQILIKYTSKKITPWWSISFQTMLFRRWLICQNCLSLWTASSCWCTEFGTMSQLCTSTLMGNTFKNNNRLKYYMAMKPTPDFLPLINDLCFWNVHVLSSSHPIFFPFVICLIFPDVFKFNSWI